MTPAQAMTREIEVIGVTFDPAVVHADLGDQLRWSVSSGQHTITAFSGGTFAFPFVQSGEVWTFNFEGGTALYRCEFHSTLDPLSLVCEGMCGAITSRTTAPGAPSFTTPSPGESIPTATFRMRGNAEPQTTVIVSEGATERTRAVANASGVWQVDVFFENGPHTVTARALDVEGRLGPPTAPLSFTITADTTPPTAGIASKDPTIGIYRPVSISGTASDNIAVEYVEIEVTPVGDRPVIYRQTTCIGCFGPSVRWFLDEKIGPGVFTVRARSVDTTGNISEWTPPIRVLSGDVRRQLD